MPTTLCALKLFFGVECPGCGLGHSIWEFLQGHWGESLAWHPMGVVVVLGVVGWHWRHILLLSTVLSGGSRKIISHVFLLGFFVPWVVKWFL